MQLSLSFHYFLLPYITSFCHYSLHLFIASIPQFSCLPSSLPHSSYLSIIPSRFPFCCFLLPSSLSFFPPFLCPLSHLLFPSSHFHSIYFFITYYSFSFYPFLPPYGLPPSPLQPFPFLSSFPFLPSSPPLCPSLPSYSSLLPSLSQCVRSAGLCVSWLAIK